MSFESSPELNALIAQARDGDADALGRLLESFRSYLRILADIEIGRRLQRKVDASDIVQEAFLDAHRQFPSFQGDVESQFAEWLRTILAGKLANTVRHYFGTQGRDVRLEREISRKMNHSSCLLSDWAVDSLSTPSNQILRGEQTMIVTDALAQLPEDYRQVLLLRHMEELPFAQIAHRMNRSVNSVEKLWLRGLTQLKRICLGGEEES
ncbi:MAG: sigma-70 family RNA polymerase sigma factor [Planctomycetes bacterium]|nr:sigma-70 family RNA polymerase sigma factor [Planctomycetota bacterium]